MTRPTERAASFALLLGTLFWGCGFTWAKAGGDAVNHAVGQPTGAALGPIFLLALRFSAGAILWLLVFPKSRRGWTRRSIGRALYVGTLLGAGLIVQHLGLNESSEAVSAFLTSLTILFVPLLMTFVLRRPPPISFWCGVVLATAGVWLMTGAASSGFHMGELLGLACAFIFSLYILAVDAVVPSDDPSRMAAGQFIVVGVICAGACLFVPGGTAIMRLESFARAMTAPGVSLNLILLTLFPTVAAFGLLTLFQPMVDPSRATLIYLFEPVFATAYAAAAGHRPSTIALIGAGLILAGNVLAELLNPGGSSHQPTPLID